MHRDNLTRVIDNGGTTHPLQRKLGIVDPIANPPRCTGIDLSIYDDCAVLVLAWWRSIRRDWLHASDR